MNIDDLKEAWKNDDRGFTHLPVDLAIQGKTISAVTRIRKNMKSEFIGTVCSYFIFIWFLFFGQPDPFLFNITSLLFFSMVILNTYYFLKFYVFYRSIGQYDASMKTSITKVAYELELNIEIYKAHSFCITPIAIMIAIGLLCGKQTSAYILEGLTDTSHNAAFHLLIMAGILLISFVGTFVLINLHMRLKYGKYLTELKAIIRDLGED